MRAGTRQGRGSRLLSLSLACGRVWPLQRRSRYRDERRMPHRAAAARHARHAPPPPHGARQTFAGGGLLLLLLWAQHGRRADAAPTFSSRHHPCPLPCLTRRRYLAAPLSAAATSRPSVPPAGRCSAYAPAQPPACPLAQPHLSQVRLAPRAQARRTRRPAVLPLTPSALQLMVDPDCSAYSHLSCPP
jgi:hypothetical protein